MFEMVENYDFQSEGKTKYFQITPNFWSIYQKRSIKNVKEFQFIFFLV